MSDEVLFEKRGKIAYVTLNRPEAMNAIDLETHERLWAVWREFRDDDALELAKETIFDVIGRRLDDQLAYEAFTGYSGAANPTVREHLESFYEKTDRGRAGKNRTEL